jgi:hypothetical protein
MPIKAAYVAPFAFLVENNGIRVTGITIQTST